MEKIRQLSKTAKTVLTVVLAAVLLLGGIALGANLNNRSVAENEGGAPSAEGLDPNAENYTGDRATYTGKKNTDTISIPGYGALNLRAGVAEQSVNLHNPEENTCYFKMSLLLEDDTKLWESGLVEPGKAVYELTLDKTLAAGIYKNAALKYECFAMDEARTQLNGSVIRLDLNVLE